MAASCNIAIFSFVSHCEWPFSSFLSESRDNCNKKEEKHEKSCSCGTSMFARPLCGSDKGPVNDNQRSCCQGLQRYVFRNRTTSVIYFASISPNHVSISLSHASIVSCYRSIANNTMHLFHLNYMSLFIHFFNL